LMGIRRDLEADRAEQARRRGAITSALGAMIGVASGDYPRTVAVVTESGWRYEATDFRGYFDAASYHPGDVETGETHTNMGRGSSLADALAALWAAEDTKQ